MLASASASSTASRWAISSAAVALRQPASSRRALSTTPVARVNWPSASSLWPSQAARRGGDSEQLTDAAPTTDFDDAAEPVAPVEAVPLQSGSVESTPVNPSAAVDEVAATASQAADTAPAPATPSNHIIGYDGQTVIDTGSIDLSTLADSWGLHPIMRMQSMFFKLHADFPLLEHGIKWAVLVPLVTIALRSILFYFQVKAQKNAAKMAIVQPKLLGAMNKIKTAKANNDLQGQQLAQVEMQQIMRSEGVNPLKSLVFPLSQGVVFACVFFALRGVSASGVDSLTTEGFAWVTNLAASDPYWILPVASTGLTFLALEYGMDSAQQVQTSAMKTMKGIFRISLLLFLPFMAKFPALVLLYWSTNNALSLLQALLLKRPAVRSFFNIPKIPRKPQPGEPGYVKEPSFMEAFKEVQVSAVDKTSNWSKDASDLKTLGEKMQRAREAASSSSSSRTQHQQLERSSNITKTETAEATTTTWTSSQPILPDDRPAGQPVSAKEQRILRAREKRQRNQQQY